MWPRSTYYVNALTMLWMGMKSDSFKKLQAYCTSDISRISTQGILFGVPESLRCQMAGRDLLVSHPIWYVQARKNKNENTQRAACLGTWTYSRYVHIVHEALSSCCCYYHWEWHQSKLNLETLRSENWKNLGLYNLTQIRQPANKTSFLNEPEHFGWNHELRNILGMSTHAKRTILVADCSSPPRLSGIVWTAILPSDWWQESLLACLP